MAHALTGIGPFLLIALGWLSHLALGWAIPAERMFHESLAGSHPRRDDSPSTCPVTGTGPLPGRHSSRLPLPPPGHRPPPNPDHPAHAAQPEHSGEAAQTGRLTPARTHRARSSPARNHQKDRLG